MNKELRIVIKRINLEQLRNENNSKNDCDPDGALLCGDEIVLMNYDDIFAENAENTYFKSEDCGAKERNTKLKYNQLQETAVSKIELEVEDDELCDVDTKIDILKKFEKNAKENGKEKIARPKQPNSDGKHITCNECGFRAKKKHHLQIHITLAHRKDPNKPTRPTEFECQYCMFKTRYKTSLGHHIGSFHMDKTQTDGSAETSPKKSCYDIQGTNVMDHCILDKNGIYHCNYCSYTNSKKFLFGRHITVHTVNKSKVFTCPQCPKKFTQQVLQMHVKKVHSDPEGLIHCPKCTFATKWGSNMRRHIRHNKDKEKCDPVQKRKKPKPMEQKEVKATRSAPRAVKGKRK